VALCLALLGSLGAGSALGAWSPTITEAGLTTGENIFDILPSSSADGTQNIVWFNYNYAKPSNQVLLTRIEDGNAVISSHVLSEGGCGGDPASATTANGTTYVAWATCSGLEAVEIKPDDEIVAYHTLPDSREAYQPAIATGAGNTAAFAYTDEGKVFYLPVDSEGELGSVVTLDSAGNYGNVHVHLAEDGEAVVGWTDAEDSRGRVEMARVSALTGEAEAPIVVSHEGYESIWGLSMAVNEDGAALFSWESEHEEGGEDLTHAVLVPAGASAPDEEQEVQALGAGYGEGDAAYILPSPEGNIVGGVAAVEQTEDSTGPRALYRFSMTTGGRVIDLEDALGVEEEITDSEPWGLQAVTNPTTGLTTLAWIQGGHVTTSQVSGAGAASAPEELEPAGQESVAASINEEGEVLLASTNEINTPIHIHHSVPGPPPTAAPTISAPTAGEASKSPLAVTYDLPEAAKEGTLRLTLSEGGSSTVLTLASEEDAAGEHTLSLNTRDLSEDVSQVASSSAGSLPDGTYALALSYQDEAEGAPASTSVSGVRIQTVTSPPWVTQPTLEGAEEGESFTVTYHLSEAALPGSVTISLVSEELKGSEGNPLIVTLDLASHASGEHSFTLDRGDPTSSPEVTSASGAIPSGRYKLYVSYQDALGNPVASSSPLVPLSTVSPDACLPGEYSADGEAPCTEASSGHYASGYEQTSQKACPAGTYDPSTGSTSEGACANDSPGTYSPEGSADKSECSPGYYTASERQEYCRPSAPGHYASGFGATSESACSAGHFSFVSGSVTCQTTPEGHYDAGVGNSHPIPCPAGSYDPDEGSTSPAACVTTPAGSWSASGQAHPTPCLAGTFGASEAAVSAEACLPAPLGTYSSEGAPSATPCPAGSYAATTSSTSCTPASPGSYVAGPGAQEETPCPAGSYSSGEGAMSCTLASPGSYVSTEGATQQSPCLAGYYSEQPGATACTPASPGSHVEASEVSQQLPCAAGTYSSSPEATSCTPASPGSYVAGPGAQEETPCPAGSYSSQPGATACTLASPGSRVEGVGAQEEVPCTAGTYSPTEGATACEVTPAGTYSTGGAAQPTPCPSGTTSAPGASSCTQVPKTPEPEGHTGQTLSPPLRHPVEATPVLSAVSISHRCVGPVALTLGSPSKGLSVSYSLNEPATISYTISRRKGSPEWAHCPRVRGKSPGDYEGVWSGTAPSSGGASAIGLAKAARVTPADRGTHATGLAAALRGSGQALAKLRPGTYILTLVATDAEGVASAPEHVKLWIVAPHHAARHKARH
jgi:hypothetical protein